MLGPRSNPNPNPNPNPDPNPNLNPNPIPNPNPSPNPNQVLGPHSAVRAHTGPTNAMLTVQCALSAAPGNWIRVGSEVRPCLQNMCMHHLLTYSPTRLLAYSPYLLTYLSPTLP